LVVENVSGTRRLQSTLVTAGSVSQVSTTSSDFHASVFLDNGTWEHLGTWTIDQSIVSATRLFEWSGGQSNLVRNTGTITKVGTTTATLNVPLDNDGTMAATEGTLRALGGSGLNPLGQESTGTWSAGLGATVELGENNLADGSAFAGAGTVALVGTNTASGTVTGAGESTLRLDGTLEVDSTFAVNGTLSWRSGVISGAGVTTVASGGSLVVENVSGTRRLQSTLVTAGSVSQVSATSSDFHASVFLDNGTWEHSGTWTIDQSIVAATRLFEWSGGQSNLVRNTGTITKTGGATATINVPLDNDGTIDAQVGVLALAHPGAGEPTGDYKASGTGTLEVNAALVLAEGATIGASPGGIVRLDDGLVADGAVTVPAGRTLTWRSGIISGAATTTVASGGSLVVENLSATRRLQSTLVTAGSVSQVSAASNDFQASVFLDNGTWEHSGTWTIDQSAVSAMRLFEWSGGQSNLVRNTGTITKIGTGTVTLDVPIDNAGTISAAAGTLQLNKTPGYDAGAQSLSGGTWLAKDGGILRLNQVIGLTTADAVLMADGNGSQIRNAANANALPGLTTITANGGLSLRNNQTLTTSGPLTTAGAVTVGANSSLTTTGLYKQNAGGTSLESNTAALTATGSRVEVQGGTLGGIGTVAPELRSTGGTIAPGNSPGILFVTGPVNLDPTARVAIEINGATPGTEHDRIQASGAVSVNGTLAITKGASYDPSLGQIFDVITGSSRTGNFSGVTPTSAGTGKGFDVNYPAGKVEVEVVSVPGTDLVISAAPLGTAFNVDYPGTWRATVSNVGGAASSGTITATLTLGAGQAVASASASGWSCSGTGPVTCTHPGPLASGASLPAIDLTVDVTAPAQPITTLGASVSGGGDTRVGNNTFNASVAVKNLVPPVAQLQVSSNKGTAPFTITADSTLSTGSIDSRSFDWGDGSTSSGLTANHTYTQPGIYTVTLRVDNEVQLSSKTQRITVVEFLPLAADAGDDRTAAPGLNLQFDGGNSTPANDIDTYAWNFGDGNNSAPSNSPVAFHAYTSPGTYTATLTITRGVETDTDTLTVTVAPPVGSGAVIDVTGEGSPLPGADVTVIDAFGVRYSEVTELSGSAIMQGLPDGKYTVYAWANGYVPGVTSLDVVGGDGVASVDLDSGAIGVPSLESRRLTYDEIIAAGIDPADPANQNVFEFDLCLAFGDYSCIAFGGVANGAGTLYSPSFGSGGPGGGGCSSTSCYYTVPEGRVTATVTVVGGQPTVTFLMIPGTAKWLKEFFEVKMAIVNLAPTGFTFEDGIATLDLPEGLALAPTADPQALDVEMEDIPGGESRTATWIIRGDDEGEYDLEASYSGTLDPIGKSIKLDAVTEEPLKVWGFSAVEMTVTADDAAVAHDPYRFTLTLENVTDGSSDPAPVYNPVLAIDRDAGGFNYIVQPDERFEQGTDVLLPGETFSADFIVVPNFSGILNVAGSAVFWAAGDDAPATFIESQPRLTALDVTNTELAGAVKLDWEPTPGAVEYRIYRTPTDLTIFPVPPVPLGTVPAGTTTLTVPAGPGPQWYVVSTIDADGIAAMRHEMIQAAPLPPPPLNISVGDAKVVEGDAGKARNVQFAVTLSEPATVPVTVDYVLVPGSAVAPADFVLGKPKTLKITPAASTGKSNTTYYVTAKVNPDTLTEGDETFTVVLSNPTGGFGLANPTATATIVDDDPGSGLRVSVGDASIWEGDVAKTVKATNNGKVWISLSEPATSTVSVTLTVAPGTATVGTDYKNVKPKTITFKAGQWQKVVSIGVWPDLDPEGDETVTLTLSNPSAGLDIGRGTGTLTILNDD
jgi:PKD repeat protein